MTATELSGLIQGAWQGIGAIRDKRKPGIKGV